MFERPAYFLRRERHRDLRSLAVALCIAVTSVRGIEARRGGHDPAGLDFEVILAYFSFQANSASDRQR